MDNDAEELQELKTLDLTNPFKPGAGQMPPYLAGRTQEQDESRRLLRQKTILQNIILTGLRGVGKTVLLETLKPIARSANWLWVGSDLSESASLTEGRILIRIVADIALMTSPLVVREERQIPLGFTSTERVIKQPLNFDILMGVARKTPGLVSDKLKAVLEFIWAVLPRSAISGVVFAYDEAQNLSDHAPRGEYPLSVVLEVFQSMQRKGIPFLLILTGLPTLFPQLVDSRTYAERMFHIMFLKQLDEDDAREAIVTPTRSCPISFSDSAVARIIELSAGYPYFIQYICKETFDVWIDKIQSGEMPSVPEGDIVRRLDVDFFHGRWARATDRQRDLLHVVATLPTADDEFTVQEIVRTSKEVLGKGRGFKPSNATQMLSALAKAGLAYRNRHGKYSLAVPLLAKFILRQTMESINLPPQ